MFFWDTIIYNIEKIISQNFLLALPAAFFGGILVSFSPCILPLIPVCLGIIADASLNTNLKVQILSVFFVLGLSLTYIILGVIASLMGIIIIRFIPLNFIYILLGLILIYLAISCYYPNLRISPFNFRYSPKKNIVSIFLLGMFSGLMMIPCALPILGTIFSLIALNTNNILRNIIILLFFSLGYGLVFFIVGSSTSLLRQLSKNKIWSIIEKRVLFLLLILLAGLFLWKGMK